MKAQAGANDCRVLILGAGPAGLTAAYELSNLGIPCVVLEREGVVGGLSRTVEYQGFRFDIGGHRFYTKVPLVQQIWREILGQDLLTCKRLSRIYYKSQFFRYPLEAMDAFRRLGLLETLRCGLSFVKSRAFPRLPEDDFEAWVSNRFGRRLFETFFKSYTEKVWGMDCREIGAEWAAQRIQGLSLWSLLRDAAFPRSRKEIRTLIQEFQYPRWGPGMLWSRMREIVEQRGVQVQLNAPVERIRWEAGNAVSVQAGRRVWEGSHVISSMPIRELMETLDPQAPESLRALTDRLRYRDFITVALVVRKQDVFPDNWIYLQESRVIAGRVQNYKNWSPEMTPSADMTCLGVEYFCTESDSIWNRSDVELVRLARGEMAELGLVREEDVVDGAVVRMPKAYPVYDRGYQHCLAAVREFLATVPNLQLVGRNGMHRYNNQDHSMLTGILAARNVAGSHFDLWNLSPDQEYLETAGIASNKELAALEKTQPLVPRPV
jgi:protoporphyrinogen oxidase